MLRGEDKLFAALDRFDAKVKGEREEIPADLTEAVRLYIRLTDSIDTGRMISAIGYLTLRDNADTARYGIGTIRDEGVFYDGFVEFDTHGGVSPGYPGRYFYRDAVNSIDFEEKFTFWVAESFVV